MNRNRIHSAWLIFIICFILAAGFLLTSVLSYLATRNYIVHSDRTRTLPLLNDNLYSMIEKDLYNPISVSSLMANDTFLINWVLEGETDRPAIAEYLAYINQKYDFTSAFFVSDVTSLYYHYDGILKQISPAHEHDNWYYDFVATDKPFELDVDTDEAKQGKLTVFINHRLETPEGDFLGVTGVGIELGKIGEQLETYRELFDHEIYLVDAAGLIQIHSDETLVKTAYIQDVLGSDQPNSFVLEESETVNVFEINSATGMKVVSTRYLPDFGWYLVIEKDESDSFGAAKVALWNNILIGLGITAVVSGIIIWLFKVYNKQIEILASYDELTGVFNRRKFLHMLKREISIAHRYGQTLAVMMIDVDDFKQINDAYGHMAGDEMLRKITTHIQAALRESDVVGRWGGDEFIAYLLNTDETSTLESAQRLLKGVKDIAIEVDGELIQRTISIGYCLYLGETELDASALIQTADEALLRSKHKGRNQVSD